MEIRFVESNGAQHPVQADAGLNAMEVAIQNGVPGIDGDCGGNAACGTCHILIDQDWLKVLGTDKNEHEEAMLELIQDAQPNSRLACQVVLDDRLDGIVIHLPEAQF